MPSQQTLKRVRNTNAKLRDSGQQSAEFAAALFILVICILLPLIDLTMLPIRSGLVSTMVSGYVRQLSLQEKFSHAITQAEDASELSARLKSIGGVNPKAIHLTLGITSVNEPGKEITVERPGNVPADWLPNGKHGQCQYTLQLSVDAEVSPLVVVPLPGMNVPGLNAPVATTFSASAPFENLGRDPVTKEFFLNE